MSPTVIPAQNSPLIKARSGRGHLTGRVTSGPVVMTSCPEIVACVHCWSLAGARVARDAHELRSPSYRYTSAAVRPRCAAACDCLRWPHSMSQPQGAIRMNPNLKMNERPARTAIATHPGCQRLGAGVWRPAAKTKNLPPGQRLDSAVEKTEQAAADARVKAESAMNKAETKMEQGAATAESTAKNAANKRHGCDLSDARNHNAQVNAGLAKDPDLSAVKINVDTVGGKCDA